MCFFNFLVSLTHIVLKVFFNRFLTKSNVNVFHLSKVHYSIQKKPDVPTTDVRLQLPDNKRVIVWISIGGTEKTFSDLWFVDNQ